MKEYRAEKLLGRLETATYGSRNLSHAVLLALDWERGQEGWWYAPDNEVPIREEFLPSPSEIIDDSLSLAPDGVGFTLIIEPGKPSVTAFFFAEEDCIGGSYSDPPGDPPEYESDVWEAEARTPALAACAALLRAVEGIELKENYE